MNYKHVLLGVDLHPNCDESTILRGVAIAKQYNAKISIVHAVEHLNAYGVAQAYPTVLDLEEEMAKESKNEMVKLGEKFAIPKENQFVEIGSPKSVILNKAKELGVDLIVVGSHGRHGIGALLGSTANGVLHYATCDVLAVRVKE